MQRERLRNRRAAETIKFEQRGQKYHATVGYFEDGRIGEIFLNSTKATTDSDIAVRDAAILLSFALQHGVTIAEISDAMTRDETGAAQGVIGALVDILDALPPVERYEQAEQH